MELPLGKIASNLIVEFEKAITDREESIKQLRGAIDGVKLLVTRIQAHHEQAGTSDVETQSN